MINIVHRKGWEMERRQEGNEKVDHLVNPEFNDARSREEMNCKAGVRREDCCVVAQNCKLRMTHPRHLIGLFVSTHVDKYLAIYGQFVSISEDLNVQEGKHLNI